MPWRAGKNDEMTYWNVQSREISVFNQSLNVGGMKAECFSEIAGVFPFGNRGRAGERLAGEALKRDRNGPLAGQDEGRTRNVSYTFSSRYSRSQLEMTLL